MMISGASAKTLNALRHTARNRSPSPWSLVKASATCAFPSTHLKNICGLPNNCQINSTLPVLTGVYCFVVQVVVVAFRNHEPFSLKTLIGQGHPFFCFTLVKCSRSAHYHDRGRPLGLATRDGAQSWAEYPVPSRPCCLPERSVEALTTRSAHEPNELENRLGHSGGAHDLRWELLGAQHMHQ